MTVEAVYEFLLTQIIVFGPLMLCGILFLAAAGIPLPATIFVLAAGAFCRQGLFDCTEAILFGLGGSLGGDSLGYFIGRAGKGWINRRLGKAASWNTALLYFEKRGGLAVFFTRWLITPLALPINLISGSCGFSYRRFFFADAAGEIIWLAVYGGLGFSLGGNWDLVSGLVGDAGGLFAGIALLFLGVFLIRKRRSSLKRRKRPQRGENSQPL